MKQYILNPTIILPIILSLIVYFLLCFQLAKNNKINFFLHSAFSIITLISIPGTSIPPFINLHPKWLIFPSANRIFIFILYVAISLILHKKFRYFFSDFLSLCLKDIAFGILLATLFFSALWSSIPGITFRYSVGLIAASALAVNIGKTYNLKTVCLMFRVSSVVVAFLGAFCSLFIPSIGISNLKGSWQGVLIHPNIFGAYLALSIGLWFPYTVKCQQRRNISIAITVGLFAIMLATESAGAILICIILVVLTAIILFFRKLPFKQAFTIFIFMTVVSLLITFIFTKNIDLVFSFFGKDPTLTGRTDFWKQLTQAISERPILGYGHRGFWLDENGSASFVKTDTGFRPVEGHNGFLDLTLDLGLIGLVLFIISLSQTTYLAFKLAFKNDSIESFIPLLFSVFLLISNNSESRLLSVDYVWFYYVIIISRLKLGQKS